MPEIGEIQEAWNKKRIFIATCVAVVIGGGLYQERGLFLGQDQLQSVVKKMTPKSSSAVAGANTQAQDVQEKKDSPSFSISSDSIQSTIQSTAQEKIEAIKKQVQNLSVDDVASSSPQVQKVINDLKSLEQYPKTQAKEMCENICKSL